MGTQELDEEAGDSRATLKVRAFFGLPLPDPQREALDGYLRQCAARATEFRWTPAANLHLTVRFLGQVEEPLARSIAEAVVDSRPDAFELALGDTGVFKRGRLARVVWIGLREGDAEARRLAAVVEAECVRAGLEPETRAFTAHLTLARARVRDGATLPQLPPPPELDSWRAAEVILYRSRLGRSGSEYEPLETIPLR